MTVAVQQDGPRIRSLREQAGFRASVFAEQVGIHRDSLANIELERKPASLGTLRRIADGLDVPLTWIVRPGSDLHAVLTGSRDGESAA